MDAAVETRREKCCVLKPEKYLNPVAQQRNGADQIQVTSQMLAEVNLKKQKVITGNMLDLINA